MEGCFLRFYLHENQRCHGKLVWEWLLDQANKLGVRGALRSTPWPALAITII